MWSLMNQNTMRATASCLAQSGQGAAPSRVLVSDYIDPGVPD
jgi:hypothetical protein